MADSAIPPFGSKKCLGPPPQAYIAAMPGWKRVGGKRLDALIVGNVPNEETSVSTVAENPPR